MVDENVGRRLSDCNGENCDVSVTGQGNEVALKVSGYSLTDEALCRPGVKRYLCET